MKANTLLSIQNYITHLTMGKGEGGGNALLFEGVFYVYLTLLSLSFVSDNSSLNFVASSVALANFAFNVLSW